MLNARFQVWVAWAKSFARVFLARRSRATGYRCPCHPAVLLLALCAPLAVAADWPTFRGPTRDGVSTETDWTHEWPGNIPVRLFKVNVKSGFSCPVVRGDRLWTMGHQRGTDIVSCLDANTGKEIWIHKYAALRLGTVQPDYEGTRATPTLDGDVLYTLSRDGKVFCLDATAGTVKWEKDLVKERGYAIPPWGFAASPVVHGDLLVLNVGTAGLALDKHTGDLKWETGKVASGYATPTEYTAAGKPRLAVFTGDAVVALEPDTGKQVWSFPWKTQYKINSADLIFHDGKLFASSAYNFGCGLLDVSTDKPTIIWKNKELLNHYNGSVLRDGHLYGFSGNNITGTGLKCLDFATGQTKWESEKPAWGNLLLAGDRLIILTQSGELIIARATPDKFAPLANAQVLGGTTWTSPVLSDGRLYVRKTDGELVALDLRKTAK